MSINTADELTTYLKQHDFAEPQMERVILFLMDEVDLALLREAVQSMAERTGEVSTIGATSPSAGIAADDIDRALANNDVYALARIVSMEFYAAPRYKRASEERRNTGPSPELQASIDRWMASRS